jgi:adenosylcobinamide-GDP ribazoletransferase
VRTGLACASAALRGGIGFLTRLPVGRDADAWDAFARTPAAFVPAGYLIGGVAALALLVPGPAPVGAFLFVLALYGVTGINHADGVADLGDAAVVHGDPDRRREVLKDTIVGVGGVLALSLVVAGLALAGLALGGLSWSTAAGVVVAAEVGAKLGMAALACIGEAAHEGLGERLTAASGPASLAVPAVLAAPALALTLPGLAAAGALAGALAATTLVLRWSRRALGGVNGDVFGATNEVARLVGLYAGVTVGTAGASVDIATGDLAFGPALALLAPLTEVVAWTPC